MPGYFLLLLAEILIPHLTVPPAFESQVLDDQVAIGYGLAIGDVDGDQKPDILLADKKQFVWYRNGDWKRFVMVENLTESDNVCIAARDIDGDGRVEVAVGAQWNPGETSDASKSGSVHYLVRPDDPTQRWTPIELHHEPTIHRMRWVKVAKDKYHLIVLPLHGRGNQGGEGAGVKVIAYEKPTNPRSVWKFTVIDESMHLTHNMDMREDGDRERLYIGGKEGIKVFNYNGRKWVPAANKPWVVRENSFGEVRTGKLSSQKFVVGIEPMHGTHLTVYGMESDSARTVLTEDLAQGHALATGDLLGQDSDQIIVGWREPNAEKKVGLKIFISQDDTAGSWQGYWVDEDGMACEDVRLADLDGDGKTDIIAAGRSSHNLKIYWNRNN